MISLKHKLESPVPISIPTEGSFCTNHYTRVWMKGTLFKIEDEIRVKCQIDSKQKCVLTHFSYFPEVNWEVTNRKGKFDKIVILSTHHIDGEISIEGGEYVMVTIGDESLHFVPTAPDSSLLVFSFYTPSEKRQKMDADLEDLMS